VRKGQLSAGRQYTPRKAGKPFSMRNALQQIRVDSYQLIKQIQRGKTPVFRSLKSKCHIWTAGFTRVFFV
jgi:hypothetical protein